MNIPNPDYNPDWEALHDFHHGKRVRLENEIDTWHKNGPSSSGHGELEALKKKLDFHHQTCLRCLDSYQHKTVQDFVQWALKNSDILTEILKQDYASHVSFGSCQSIEQAKIIISRLYELQEKDSFLNNKGGGYPCLAERPAGFDIFEKTGSNNISTKWMNVTTRCNFGSPDSNNFIVLTSVDVRQNEKHVCFYADADNSRDAHLIMAHIGQLAFQFIQNDLGSDFDKFAKSQARKKPGLSIARFFKKQKPFPVYHFYTHTIMAGALPREDFIEHIFEYDDRQGSYNPRARLYGSFRRKKMQPYKVMPQYLKDAVQQYIGFEAICIQG